MPSHFDSTTVRWLNRKSDISVGQKQNRAFPRLVETTAAGLARHHPQDRKYNLESAHLRIRLSPPRRIDRATTSG